MRDNKLLTGSMVIIAVVVVGFVLRIAKPVLFPFCLALLFYFILSPVLDGLVRLRIPKPVAIVVIVLFFFLALYLMGVMFYSSGKAFSAQLHQYGDRVNEVQDYLRERMAAWNVKWEPTAMLGSLDVNKIGSFLLSSLGSFVSFISNLFLIFLFLVFMLAGRGKITVKVDRAFSGRQARKINQILSNIDGQVQKYLAIKTIISVLTALVAWLVLALFKLDFAIVFAFLIFLFNYIPNIGSVISTLAPVLFAFFQFGSVWPALWILILILVVDNLFSNVLEPKLMGRGLGLSPLAVLFSLFFWGWLWGIPGMILAVPITAVIKIICGNIPSLRFVESILSS
ncbi:MAG: AI-2E family transporter [Candidatus Aminicenantes bacterium]|nr:AI-2E family transporter [Candidatus Aminicenantes bacterium]